MLKDPCADIIPYVKFENRAEIRLIVIFYDIKGYVTLKGLALEADDKTPHLVTFH